jgi:uncharacterized membrane protein YwaF
MKNKISGIWFIIEGLLLLFGPFYIFKVCEIGDKIMKCYWSSRAQIAFGIIGIIIGILMILSKNKETKVSLYILEIVNCTLSILVPKFLIGGCLSEVMKCQSITFPSIYFLNTITITLSVILLIIEIRRKEGVN